MDAARLLSGELKKLEKTFPGKKKLTDSIAKKYNLSRTRIIKLIKLTTLCDSVQLMIDNDLLLAGQAIAISNVPHDLQKKLADKTLSRGLTVRELESEIKTITLETIEIESFASEYNNEVDPDVERVISEMEDKFGVSITPSHKGRVQNVNVKMYDRDTITDLLFIPNLLAAQVQIQIDIPAPKEEHKKAIELNLSCSEKYDINRLLGYIYDGFLSVEKLREFRLRNSKKEG